ncbi:transposase [Solihabitans fulvus]|uniref:Transposase n=1 Tax=Solihabitans fulvus TaxID=1892852 RepID=A0A5B2WPU6_9PSEU|nr:transposase [Solihabitans fulvus]
MATSKADGRSWPIHVQYSGTAKWIGNCQIGVFLAYATSRPSVPWHT